MNRIVLALAAALLAVAPAIAQNRVLPNAEVDTSGNVRFRGGPELGKMIDGVFTPVAPTQPSNDNSDKAASTAFVQGLLSEKAPLANPAFTGTATANVLHSPGWIKTGKQADPLGLVGGLCVGGGDPAESGSCAWLSSDGLANWMRIQTSKNYNPQEVNIYGAAGQGRAASTIGTNTLTRVDGTPFDPAWVGETFYWNGTIYRVTGVSGSSLTVVTTGGGAVSFPSNTTGIFHYVRTTGSGTLDTNGTAVTWKSGDPFVPFTDASVDFRFKINGTLYQVASFTDLRHLVLTTSAGVQTNVPFTYSLNINDQIATLRVQKLLGANEENLTISARATNEYEIRAGVSGYGQYHPIRIKNGDDGGVPHVAAEFGANAVTLGGPYPAGALSVLSAPPANSINRFEIQAAPAGISPAFRARGADTAVGMGFDAQGTGDFNFTSGTFTTTLAKIVGSPPAPGFTSIQLLVNNGSSTTLYPVSIAGPDSCGTGKRCLSIPN